MPTTVYDSSLITQRNQAKAVSGSFISRIENAANPQTGSAPILGITDQSIINLVKNGEMKEYRKNEFGCTTVNSGCPCPPPPSNLPGLVGNITYTYGSIIASWTQPVTGETTFYDVILTPLQGFYLGPKLTLNFNQGLLFQAYDGYFDNQPTRVNWFTTAKPNYGETGVTSDLTNIGTSTNGLYPATNADPPSTFSVQWTGYFVPPESGSYTFKLTSDDASYFWIGQYALTGYSIANATIDNGGLHGPVEETNTVSLTKDIYYPVRLQYGENTGGEVFSFAFTKPSAPLVNIFSGNYFFSTKETLVATTTNTTYTFPNSQLLPSNNSYVLSVTAGNPTGYGQSNFYKSGGDIASVPTQ